MTTIPKKNISVVDASAISGLRKIRYQSVTVPIITFHYCICQFDHTSQNHGELQDCGEELDNGEENQRRKGNSGKEKLISSVYIFWRGPNDHINSKQIAMAAIEQCLYTA